MFFLVNKKGDQKMVFGQKPNTKIMREKNYIHIYIYYLWQGGGEGGRESQ